MTEVAPTRIDDPAHHWWLAAEANRLLIFYRDAADPIGGFCWLDDSGRPDPGEPSYLWITTRMVHCFGLAHLLGDQTAAELVDHGIAALDDGFRDPAYGGWFWSVGANGPVDAGKQAYGHAFVLLAASTALQAGRPGTRQLVDDAVSIIDQWFWSPADKLCVDSYSRDWATLDTYRGVNANMHMTEAFIAASEATGEHTYMERAAAIANRIIHEFTTGNDWRLPEHFDAAWRPLLEYHADAVRDPFRPYGSTVGHWLEWVRLLLQLHATPRVSARWMVDASIALFDKAIIEGWDAHRGGFIYTVDWNGQPVVTDRLHWVITEAIGAAVALYRATGDPTYDQWYARFWDHATEWFIDSERGSWTPQLDENGKRITDPWHGRPDLYHALQATLYARYPAGRGLAAAVAHGGPRGC